jgi:hypothetical protein
VDDVVLDTVNGENIKMDARFNRHLLIEVYPVKNAE